MSQEKRNTPLMEFDRLAKEEYFNRDLTSYEIIMLNKLLSIARGLLPTEKEVIKEAFKQGHEDGYNFEGSRHDYEAEGLEEYLSGSYFNTIFNQ